MGQKRFNLGSAHVFRMLLVVEQDESADPVDIGLFGAEAVMLGPDFVADLIEEFGCLRR